MAVREMGRQRRRDAAKDPPKWAYLVKVDYVVETYIGEGAILESRPVEIKGDIQIYSAEADDYRTIARCELYACDLDAGDIESTLDIEEKTAELVSLFDLASDDWIPEVKKALSRAPVSNDILFFDLLEVLPEFRGRGVVAAKVFADVAVRFGGGAEVMVIKSFPLQHTQRRPRRDPSWEAAMALDDIPKKPGDSKRLGSYYKRLGFRPVKGTEYMVAWLQDLREGVGR
jgi:hypothetical protein